MSKKIEGTAPDPELSLKRKAVNAAAWNMGLLGAQYGFRLASNLIMTRLLMPEAWGLLSFAAAVMTALNLFTDIGINQSIIREVDGDKPHFLRVAWTLKIVRSLVISGGIVLLGVMIGAIAPHFAPPDSVYTDPRLPLMIALMAVTTMAQGLESSNKDVANRRMDYRRFTLITVASQALSIVTMVGLALVQPSVWALVSGMLSNSIYLCLFTHFLLPGPTMKLAWDREIIRRIWRFGKWIILSSSFTLVQTTADQFILGALLSTTAFGLYVISQVWVSSVRNVVTLLGVRLGTPIINEVLRERPQDLPRVYRQFQSAIDAMCVVGFLCLFFGGTLLITLLYTPKYHYAAHYLVLMSTYVLTSRFEPYTSLLISVGNSRAQMMISLIRAVSLCAMLPVANALLGIDAAMMVVALLPIVTVPYALGKLRPLIGNAQVRIEWMWLGASIAVASLVYARVSLNWGL